jgi:pSer/pThr/pTyr-binding forkhead associated (FHA) protein
MYRLAKPIVTLGRDAANDIPINDPEVSRYHLRFTQQGQGYAVEDLGSTNGTMIEGKRISGLHPLRAGTALNLGDTILLSYEVV